MREVEDLTNDELFEIVYAVREALWPNGDGKHVWSPDTLEEVAAALSDKGLAPEDK